MIKMIELSNEIIIEDTTPQLEIIDESLLDYFTTFLETYVDLKEEYKS